MVVVPRGHDLARRPRAPLVERGVPRHRGLLPGDHRGRASCRLRSVRRRLHRRGASWGGGPGHACAWHERCHLRSVLQPAVSPRAQLGRDARPGATALRAPDPDRRRRRRLDILEVRQCLVRGAPLRSTRRRLDCSRARPERAPEAVRDRLHVAWRARLCGSGGNGICGRADESGRARRRRAAPAWCSGDVDHTLLVARSRPRALSDGARGRL
mmetsp:Transcript_23989/g.70788  ORF Transcript_23989/g.70788 Transcript_23989/m.70788 type:complete len:213 (-) Transcript_23989:59-697(-)